MTPVELRDGRWYKRDDLHRDPSGVNGGQWRQCTWLVDRMRVGPVVTGASVLSPQHAMTAVAAQLAGLPSFHVVGGTTPEKALAHPSPRLAVAHGAELRAIGVGYNPALQREAHRLAAQLGGTVLHYGVTPVCAVNGGCPPPDAETLRAFHQLGADQTANLPAGLAELIVPFGSGNSAASILLGLAQHPEPPARVHLVGIGPNRRGWLGARLRLLGARPRSRLIFHDLYSAGLAYGTRVVYTSDGIHLHPTYEAKVARWADTSGQVPGWLARDGTAAFWIVGAAI